MQKDTPKFCSAINRNERHSSSTAQLLTIKFLICNGLTVLLTIFEEMELLNVLPPHIVDLSNLLVVMNSATNFIVYFKWSRLFRSSDSTGLGNGCSGAQSKYALQYVNSTSNVELGNGMLMVVEASPPHQHLSARTKHMSSHTIRLSPYMHSSERRLSNRSIREPLLTTSLPTATTPSLNIPFYTLDQCVTMRQQWRERKCEYIGTR